MYTDNIQKRQMNHVETMNTIHVKKKLKRFYRLAKDACFYRVDHALDFSPLPNQFYSNIYILSKSRKESRNYAARSEFHLQFRAIL